MKGWRFESVSHSKSGPKGGPIIKPAKGLVRLFCTVSITAGLWPGHVSAGLEEVEDGVFVEDFEDGMLLDWELEGRTDAEIDEGEDNSLLNVRAAGRLTLVDLDFRDFAAEVTINGGGAGLHFGGKYQALITMYGGGSLRISEKGKELALLKRGYKIGRSYRLKVVCFASFIRVYVNGRKEFEKTDASPAEDTIALVTGEKGALLDDVRISTKLSPEVGAMAEPVEEDQALIFSSEDEAKLHLKTANACARDLRLIASVTRYRGRPVPEPGSEPAPKKTGDKDADSGAPLIRKYGVRFYYAIEPLPGKPVARTETVLKAKTAKAIDLNLGKLPPGSYLLDLALAWDGKTRSCRKCPLAVFENIDPSPCDPVPIPVGPYTHKVPKEDFREEHPLWYTTYMHTMALVVRKYNMNMVVANGAYDPPAVEILNRYGVAVMERGDKWLDHPGVIGTLLGDEPHGPELDYYKAEYEAVQKRTEKPVTTACIGEGIGMGGKHFFWKETNPKVRVFRWYGIKKHFYGIHYPVTYKGILPFEDVLRVADAMFDTPYWVSMPTNGGTEHEAYFQYPSPAQHRGYMHLCMAHGAKGMLLYSLQNQFGTSIADTVTLEPNGGNLAAIGEVAGHVKRHGKLLASLKIGGLDVRCKHPDIDPVPRHDGQDGRYVYVVNRNTRESVSCKLFWPSKLGRADVTDVFAGKKVPTEKGDRFVSVSFDMIPGEGRLLEVSE